MKNQKLIDCLKQALGEEKISQASVHLAKYRYDCWPVAVKWKAQGKVPCPAEIVVRPKSTEEVSVVLKLATEHGCAVTPWGAGSSVTGAPLPVRGGIILDLSGMNEIISVNETNLLVRVGAGVMGDRLEFHLNERGFTLNHSPQSLNRSTVAGWLATRATGQFSSRYGGIEDLAANFTVVLSSGEIVKTHQGPRAATGPDLRHCFMGAEGTMGVITEVTLRIFPQAPLRLFEALAFRTVEEGLRAMQNLMQSGLRPFLLRFYDVEEARHAMRDPAFSSSVMFLGCEGIPIVARAEMEAALDIGRTHGGSLLGATSVEAWMNRRFDFSTIENHLTSPGGVAETIEIAHYWSDIFSTYQSLKKKLASQADEVLCHFSHAYDQGVSLYIILLGKAIDDAEAEKAILRIWDATMQICLEKHAIISHHHGIGLARNTYLRASLKQNMIVLEKLKAALDPTNIMNPGKLGLPLDGNFHAPERHA